MKTNLKIVRQLASIAESLAISPAVLALAWLLAQGEDIVPIPGTKRPTYAAENASAASVRLSADDLEKIAEIVNPENVAGARYDAASLSMVDTDD